VECLIDLTGLAVGLVRERWGAALGAILRFVVMAGLGVIAIRWQRRWAQFFVAGIQYATAAVGLVAAFVPIPTGPFRFKPSGLVIFVVYALLGIAASIDPEEPGPETEGAGKQGV
jgi:hypothetical protein